MYMLCFNGLLFILFAACDASLHVVFSAECSHLFDWQSAAVFYSFFQMSAFNRTADITRLLACSDEDLQSYPFENMNMGPTFVHENLRYSTAEEVGHASYNKPYSVVSWLEKEGTNSEFVLVADADILFRSAIDPIALGCRRGIVISAEYTYLIGTKTGFARRFVTQTLIPRLAQVGGFHIFHRDDLRRIAPLWLKYTKQVRNFAQTHTEVYYAEALRPRDGNENENSLMLRESQSIWHAEMYGYIFAAARANVAHRVRRDVMLYLGHEPYLRRQPAMLHYGNDYTVRNVYFNKLDHANLKISSCPGMLFGAPQHMDWNGVSKRDAFCIEHLATLDASLCWYYRERAQCPSLRLPVACYNEGEENFRTVVLEAQEIGRRCINDNARCDSWAREGECDQNPTYMYTYCPRSCDICSISTTDLASRVNVTPPFYDILSESVEEPASSTPMWMIVIVACIVLLSMPRDDRHDKLNAKCAV